ncbi:MAG: hypothetical protein K0R46_1665 [Herbinix sp.]|jgi:hypothetical protein|nr:hypothetical protein [Herbinix sp.]
MDYSNDSNATPNKDTGSKNVTTESDIDYGSSSEVSNPHPSIATPDIPNEMPVREGTSSK